MTTIDDAEVSIPVIDISKHNPQVAVELIEAVIKWGFVYVHGDVGFTSPEIEGMFEIVRFSLLARDVE